MSLIGENWAAKLNYLTRELHNAVEEAVIQNRESNNELAIALEEKESPDCKKMLRLF